MKHVALSLALVVAVSTTGCAHKQLTNRQVAIGIGAAVLVVVVIYAMSTCDDSGHPDGCNFK